MQTKPETEVGTLSGARQVPLMTRDQIAPGVIFTGIAADHVHEVLGVDGNIVRTQYLPARTPEPGHTHAYTQHNNASCRCGMNQYDISAFLPSDGRTPKVHILIPTGTFVPVDSYSLYLLMGPGGSLTVRSGNNDRGATPSTPNDDMPVISRGIRVWTLTGPARRMLEEDDNNAPAASGTEG